MSSEVDLLLGLEGGRNETKRQVPTEAWQSLAQAEVKASTQREAEVAQSVREELFFFFFFFLSMH